MCLSIATVACGVAWPSPRAAAGIVAALLSDYACTDTSRCDVAPSLFAVVTVLTLACDAETDRTGEDVDDEAECCATSGRTDEVREAMTAFGDDAVLAACVFAHAASGTALPAPWTHVGAAWHSIMRAAGYPVGMMPAIPASQRARAVSVISWACSAACDGPALNAAELNAQRRRAITAARSALRANRPMKDVIAALVPLVAEERRAIARNGEFTGKAKICKADFGFDQPRQTPSHPAPSDAHGPRTPVLERAACSDASRSQSPTCDEIACDAHPGSTAVIRVRCTSCPERFLCGRCEVRLRRFWRGRRPAAGASCSPGCVGVCDAVVKI